MYNDHPNGNNKKNYVSALKFNEEIANLDLKYTEIYFGMSKDTIEDQVEVYEQICKFLYGRNKLGELRMRTNRNINSLWSDLLAGNADKRRSFEVEGDAIDKLLIGLIVLVMLAMFLCFVFMRR